MNTQNSKPFDDLRTATEIDREIGRRPLLRGFLTIASVATIGAGVAACDTNPDGSAGDETPSAGGRVSFGVVGELADFDPYNHLQVNFPVLHTLYSYLINYDDHYDPHPSIAESWTIAPDNESMEIKLVKTNFHDGSPVTAQDIIAGIKRAHDPSIGISQIATNEFIKTAKAIDQRTVELQFKRPSSETKILDFMYWFPVVKTNENNPEDLKTSAAGCGPFVVESYSPGVNLVLKKFSGFYQNGKPYLDEIEFRFFQSTDALSSGVLGGSVDGGYGLETRYVDRIRSGGYSAVPGAPGALITQFHMNPHIPPFDNDKLRQALARAIDRKRIIKQLKAGVGEPVYTGYPPNSPVFSPDVMDENAYDLDIARRLLTEAGGGRSATASVDASSALDISALEIIQEDFAKIGFNLTIRPVDTATLNETYYNGELAALTRAAANPFRGATALMSQSAFRLVENPLLRDEVPEQYREAVESANRAVTPQEQKAAYERLNLALIDGAWAVGMFTLEKLHVFSDEVTGYERTPSGHPLFTNVRVE